MPSPARAWFRWWSSLDRSPRDIERDIDDEIAFHLDCAAREFEAQGLSADEARAAARERFGDIAVIAAACRKTQLGSQIMLQRIQLVVLVALVLAIGAMAWRSQAAQAAAKVEVQALRNEIAMLMRTLAISRGGVESASATSLDDARASWLTTVQSAHGSDEAKQVAEELAALDPSESTAVLARIFPAIASRVTRLSIVRAFVQYGGKSNALSILQLALADADASIRDQAKHYLRTYALRSFASDEEALEWITSRSSTNLTEVLEASTAELLKRLQQPGQSEFNREFALLAAVDPRVLEKSGGKRLLQRVRDGILAWMQAHENDWSEENLKSAVLAAKDIGLDTERLPTRVRDFASRTGTPR